MLEDNSKNNNILQLKNQFDLLNALKHVSKSLHTDKNLSVSTAPRVYTSLHQMLSNIKPKGLAAQSPHRHPLPRVQSLHAKPLPRVQNKYLHTTATPTMTLPVQSFFENRKQNKLPFSPVQQFLSHRNNFHRSQTTTHRLSTVPNLSRSNPEGFPLVPLSSFGTPPINIQANHIYDPQGKKIPLDKLLMGKDTKEIWTQALNNELGRLANGYAKNKIKGTNIIQFIKKQQIPVNKKIT